MIFSSLRYFIFVAALLLILAPAYSTTRKKQVLALASCVFYAAWDYRYLGLLLLISVIDYAAAARIAATNDASLRKRWLVASVASNLSILGYFKYYGFFIGSLNGFLAPSDAIDIPHILLPAGISFYTFKSMSYTIDVYREEIAPVKSQLDYTTFVTFFPELIAGPIVRASVFLPQMSRDIGPTRDRLIVGANIFVMGLLKKKLIADRMAGIADPIFANPSDFAFESLWCGAAAYAIQIYCDFAGYSDMAIGTAKMMGYDLPENFDMPYASGNISEFWRRWHMTLSAWLRDYLYVPLGGNRLGASRTYVNLMITMLLGGLWHGASWNFVLWGFLHGLALAVHRFWRGAFGTRYTMPKGLGVTLTLLLVVVLWVPFRATTFEMTWAMLYGMFGGRGLAGIHFVPEYLGWAVGTLVIAHVVGTLLRRDPDERGHRFPRRMLEIADSERLRDDISGVSLVFRGRTAPGAFLIVFALGMLFFFGETATAPFVYFQF